MSDVHDWPVVTSVGEAGLTLEDVRRVLDAELLVPGRLDVTVHAVGAADLMSDVLALGRPGMLLLTGLTTAQAVRTAAVADCAGVVFVRDKRLPDDVLAVAREAGVPLLRTRLTLFEASGRLYVAIQERLTHVRRVP